MKCLIVHPLPTDPPEGHRINVDAPGMQLIVTIKSVEGVSSAGRVLGKRAHDDATAPADEVAEQLKGAKLS